MDLNNTFKGSNALIMLIASTAFNLNAQVKRGNQQESNSATPEQMLDETIGLYEQLIEEQKLFNRVATEPRSSNRLFFQQAQSKEIISTESEENQATSNLLRESSEQQTGLPIYP